MSSVVTFNQHAKVNVYIGAEFYLHIYWSTPKHSKAEVDPLYTDTRYNNICYNDNLTSTKPSLKGRPFIMQEHCTCI